MAHWRRVEHHDGRAHCMSDGLAFDTPEEALAHRERYPAHKTWSIPTRWLQRTGVLTVPAFWREVRRGI